MSCCERVTAKTLSFVGRDGMKAEGKTNWYNDSGLRGQGEIVTIRTMTPGKCL